MNGCLKKSGAPSLEELKKSPGFPKPEDYTLGNIAVIECTEEIPCNPCETSCPKNAITVGNPITNLPTIDFKKCIGCGICAAKCPGIAVHLINLNYAPDKALITFPYEYLPLPEVNEYVTLVDRMGKGVCDGKVEKVTSIKSYDLTKLIAVSFDKKYYEDVISMKRIK
ncbi:4Fe-4S binding protein [Sedimentibacter sp.]|uniref:NADH-quinone oxidoreductase subunit I n=1 Tax=Sedimentibacter sp. TaxID=1960295 RepID=UPI0028AAC81A|nr:4Fe-4S binding protein [Sedimentibacter sp.]